MDDQGPEEGCVEGEEADSVSGVGPPLLYFFGTFALEKASMTDKAKARLGD